MVFSDGRGLTVVSGRTVLALKEGKHHSGTGISDWDTHASCCTVATVGPSGRRLHPQVAETNAGALIRTLRGIAGTRHLCLEEGTHASWLYEVLSPHVEEIVVAGVSESRGP